MNIIDAHMHLPVYDYLKTFEEKRNKLIEDLKTNNISQAIVIADSDCESNIGTNKQCVELFEEYSNVHVMAGISPLIQYENKLTEIKEYLRRKTIVGIKIYPGHENFPVDDKSLEKTFNLCEEYDVPLAIHTGWNSYHLNSPQLIKKLAINHPKLKIVYCHIGYPNIESCYNITKEYENIYYDIAALGDESHRIAYIKNVLNKMIKQVPNRIIFGTDYSACNQKVHINLINALNGDEHIKNLIFNKNAERLYRLPNEKRPIKEC